MTYGYNTWYTDARHRTFTSFYHRDDQCYKDYIDSHFGNIIINESVMDGEYDPDDSDEYIKRLIRTDKITASSVVLVLIGPNTHSRKHVDWEIYAGLDGTANGRAGLAGIVLPEVRLTPFGQVPDEVIPPRLNDNLKTGYAKLYPWNQAISSTANFKSIVDTAFNDRIRLASRVDNSRLQMKINGHS